MKTNKSYSLLIISIAIIFLISFTQCSVKKNTRASKKNQKTVEYKTCEARCTGIYNDAFNEQSFNAFFRIENHQYIWISLTGPLSIEGARILIMPDSVALIDRLNKKFFSGSYTAFQNKYHIPITFDMLQKTIIGDFQLKDINANCVLEQDLNVCTIKNESTVTSYYLHPKNYTLEKIRVKDRYSVRELTINFAGYQTISGQEFSFNKNFEISTPNEMAKLQLEFSKVEFDKTLEFNFSVPESYQKINF